MVKRIIILSVVFMCTSLFHVMKSQITDSICDEYFRDLEEIKPLLNLWSNPPILKENSTPLLHELCNIIVSNDSCKNFHATLILDIKGVPICIKIYPEIIRDSLKNEIIKLVYQLEFEPAITGYQNPVVSHYLSLLTDKNNQKIIFNKKGDQ